MARRPDLVIVKKKKEENLPNCGLCCSGWPQGKTERKRKERLVHRLCYRTKRNLWNMKVTVIPLVIGALGTVTKWLVQGLEDEWRPSKLQHWHRPEYSKEFWGFETCCYWDSNEKTSANIDVKNSQNRKIIIIYWKVDFVERRQKKKRNKYLDLAWKLKKN